ncbi:MAG: ferritin family protein [Deltaproteobacteria bacterium]|jgi:rubrerythrin|nr:ferritin family protein [Deltaproteobacteria bacterium]
MIYPFNATEAFKIAVGIEENGFRFYTQAAKKLPPGKLADLFISLAKEEEIHKATFTHILSGLPQEQDNVFDPENETDQYLKMMSDINIFQQGAKAIDEALAGVLTVKDALKLAMTFEKDSIVFYVQLKNSTETLADKVSVDHLILEEAKHLRKLAIIYNTIT